MLAVAGSKRGDESRREEGDLPGKERGTQVPERRITEAASSGSMNGMTNYPGSPHRPARLLIHLSCDHLQKVARNIRTSAIGARACPCGASMATSTKRKCIAGIADCELSVIRISYPYR